MTGAWQAELSVWIAIAFAAFALAAGFGAAASRSLFAVIACIAAASAASAAALAALAHAEIAVALGLFGAGAAPVMLLNTLALTTRAANRQRRRVGWIVTGALAVLVGAAAVYAERAGAPLAPASAGDAWLGAYLAGFAAVSGVCALALLGFGERGASAAKDASESAAR